MRYDILGWDGYSIDDNLGVYSSKSGKEKPMKAYRVKKTDCYVIRLRNGRGKWGWFTPQRLYFAATHGIDPTKIPRDFRIDKNCNVTDGNSHMERLRKIKSDKPYENKQVAAADSQSKINERKQLLVYSVQLQYESIEKGDYKELLLWLIGQKNNVSEYIAHYSQKRKNEILEAWTDSAIYVVDKVKNSHYIIGDIVDRTRIRAEHLNAIERKRNALMTQINERLI